MRIKFSKYSPARKAFTIFNYVLWIILAAICLVPIINVLSVSLSSSAAVDSGAVKLWPVNFTLKSYKYVMDKPEFMRAFWISVKRVIIGVPFSMLITILTAYPLSRQQKFKGRKIYVIYFLITMLFSGGLIPWYMVISKLKLIDSFWALILPSAVSVYNIIILMNFFRELPGEIIESAYVDGASELQVLFTIVVPMSMPSIATLTLFTFVTHWNSWFDGLLLMNSASNYPLQSYLQTVIVNKDMSLMSISEILNSMIVSDSTSKAAQTFIAAIPVMIIYPFLQRYFVTGIQMGGVKE